MRVTLSVCIRHLLHKNPKTWSSSLFANTPGEETYCLGVIAQPINTKSSSNTAGAGGRRLKVSMKVKINSTYLG